VTITAQNPFRGHNTELDSPFHQALAVTPDDANDLVNVCRGIQVTVAGNLHCTFADDTTPVTIAVSPGFTYRFMLARVWATGTTATGIVALY
jgi:hypothetical protein